MDNMNSMYVYMYMPTYDICNVIQCNIVYY